MICVSPWNRCSHSPEEETKHQHPEIIINKIIIQHMEKFQDCSCGFRDLISLHKLGIKVLHDYKTNYVTRGIGKVVPHGRLWSS